IDGKPTMSAEAMRALILAAGHEIYPEEATNTRAVMVGRRSDSKQTIRKTWTMDDAKRARLSGRPNYQAYPRQMLVARATAELAREVFPDVIHGMLATEEIDPETAGEATPELPAPSTPPTTTKRRRRTSAATPAPPVEPVPEPEPEETPDPDPPS